jgi:anthranilate phosphoribosyltransferase
LRHQAAQNQEHCLTASAIAHLESGQFLTSEQADALMQQLLNGELATPEIVRVLLALNARPIRPEELLGFALAMRGRAASVFPAGSDPPEHLVDTCGTGGDGAATFNISTAAAIVAAAAGARVAKHGNRSATSRSGSADVLEALGVRIDIPLERSGRAIREIGIGFLFAPAAHSAARHAAAARKQIGARTIFNLLGPLTNPAGARAQVLGVFSLEVLETVAEVLTQLGAERAFVVHGAGGLDEISLAGESAIAEVRAGKILRYTVAPEAFGVPAAPLEKIAGGSPQDNACIIRSIFDAAASSESATIAPARDIVIVNAAAALLAAGLAEDFRRAAAIAGDAIHSGKARAKLAELIAFTQG